MEKPRSPCVETVRERLKQEQQFAWMVMFAVEQAFADRTDEAQAFGLRPPKARCGDQGVVASERIFLQAAE